MKNVYVLLSLFLFCLKLSHSSSGDQDYYYRKLFRECLNDRSCSSKPNSEKSHYFLYPDWDCTDYCHYEAMHNITMRRIDESKPILKYYGHWPFIRYFGWEEPASTVFSALNSVPHLVYVVSGRSVTVSSHHHRHAQDSRKFMEPWLAPLPALSSAAWLFSAVFHAHKTDFTTRCDYITALSLLSYSLFVALRRVWGPVVNKIAITELFLIYLIVLAWRIAVLSVGPIDFGEHMTICIAISVVHTIVWIYWIFLGEENRSKEQRSHKWLCLVCQVWFSAAAMLEVFDFPPILGIFDAHSLWHLLTIPLGAVWYRFWEQDLNPKFGTKTVKLD